MDLSLTKEAWASDWPLLRLGSVDFTLPGRRHHYRLLRHPSGPDADTTRAIQALVRRQSPEVGIKASEEALLGYTTYPIITLAYVGARLVGYHGMSIARDGQRFIANLGSLYVEDGEPRGLGHALMILSALPDLLSHPTWPLTFYTLTRCPRVVASGVRWIDTFFPDPHTGLAPPGWLLKSVTEDLARRGEYLENRNLLTLAPPTGGYESIPLPQGAWSRDTVVNAYMERCFGEEGDRRVLVLGEVTLKELMKILRRSVLAPAFGRLRYSGSPADAQGPRPDSPG